MPLGVINMRDTIIRLAMLLSLIPAALAGAAVPSSANPAVTLDWQPCSEVQLAGLDCATLQVPRNYRSPASGTISLALLRAKATGGPGDRIGSLFFNPGGPGLPSYEVMPSLAREVPVQLRNAFDIVSWDPRGVGRSAGLNECRDGSYSLPAVGTVNWLSVVSEMRRTTRAANIACWKRYRDIAPYVGTVSTARDLDRLREAVGDEKLTFWGTSYGTRIGFVYATLYPERIRAMLLSSPVEPGGTWKSFSIGSALSPDTAAGFFFEVKPEAREHYRRAIAALEVAPLTLPSGHRFTRWDLRGTLGAFMHSEMDYGAAADFLRHADMALNGSGGDQAASIQSLNAMEWTDRYPVNGGATPFIGCADYPQRLSRYEQDKTAATIRKQAPIAGFSASQGLFYCEGVPPAIDPLPTIGSNKAQMLIIASTRDALTQYGWANDAAREFPDSRIISYVGGQHTPYLQGSSCVDSLGTDYLLTLKRPELDASCPSLFGKNGE